MSHSDCEGAPIPGPYGEIYQVNALGETIVVVNSPALVAEVCDESRFQKQIDGGLREMRSALNNGLITAETSDPAWRVAHRIAMPCFSPVKIRELFDDMKDIVSQLCLKWARLGPSYVIDVNVDLTRMALDVVGLCAMGYRFNTFYDHNQVHPFAEALNSWLLEVDARSWRLPFGNNLHPFRTKKYYEDIDTMRRITQEVIDERRHDLSSEKKNDLLAAMMEGRDAETGARLSNESLIDNILSLLGAGHETTSGTLSFALYFLLHHPGALTRAQQEVDRVLGNEPLCVDHLSKLPYIDAIIRETLRLQPTVPLFGRASREDEIIGGRYQIRKGNRIFVCLFASQRDPKVFGDDADQWRPERMLGERFKELPAGAWKPFGTGARACIGRPFAWQEAQITLAMLLHTFNFEMDDPSYQLHWKDAITLNPLDFKIRARLRDNGKYTQLLNNVPNMDFAFEGNAIQLDQPKEDPSLAPITVLYGSDNGTARSLAHRFASGAAQYGHRAMIDTLDSYKERLPKDRPVIIFVSTYNGEPPMNASHFVSWVQSLSGDELQGVNYAVFGCGHRDWHATFQRIPRLIDNHMHQRGANRLFPLYTADASISDMVTNLREWEKQIWPVLLNSNGMSSETVTNPNNSIVFDHLSTANFLESGLCKAYVSDTRVLTTSNSQVKKHMEIQLPSGSAYKAGDYIAILPVNPPETVQRVLARLQLSWDSVLGNSHVQKAEHQSNAQTTAHEMFSRYVELNQPVSKGGMRDLADLANDEPTKRALEQLSEELDQHQFSVLDVLEQHRTIQISVEKYLAMLPPLRVRTYSISSSPLQDPARATITYSVVHQPPTDLHRSALLGVTSNYLAWLAPGSLINMSIRSPRHNFTLPQDPKSKPLLMIAAGAGIAPFRGFAQERFAVIQARKDTSSLAPALLFFGCRDSELDDLYREEFDAWEAAGAVKCYRAYSRPSSGKGQYVQDVLQEHEGEVRDLWARGANCYVCGAPRMAEGVKMVMKGICGDISEDRYLVEIFS
ncbi:bifunctional cytochrome P450/NADPH--P450 reductase [Aspergillus melleus]|uniref:bifunctional cytochrome P450/NADPH--P450 reductase n=1 Tax=Aspergillus melleus TaxID=138277 RepID=UPI001E8D3FEC|nr:uncharacterized protein LDX57_011763 [Aspergillus melleus]KAH8434125.1 hypothetical protein LDX57_011763 [Aspergillus melleus]